MIPPVVTVRDSGNFSLAGSGGYSGMGGGGGGIHHSEDLILN